MAKFGNFILTIVIILICSISLVGCILPSGGDNIGGGGNGGNITSPDPDGGDGDITSPDPDGSDGHVCISSDWITVVATCMDSGRRTRTCTECGDMLEQVILPIDNSAHRADCKFMECGHHTSTDKAHTTYNNKECSGYHLSCYEGAHSNELCGSKMLSYIEIAGGLSVKRSGNIDVTVYIPSEHNGEEVIKISDNAFKVNTMDKNNNLTNLFIADTVLEIGESAFANCTKLQQVDFAQVEVIGEHAFSNTGLVSITLPSTITKIGFAAFYLTSNLVSMTLSHMSTESGKDHFGYIFGAESHMTNATYVPPSLRSVYFVGEGISLSQFSMYDIVGIENIYLCGVASIADYAFADCGSSLRLHVSGEQIAPSNWGKSWNVREYEGEDRFVTEWNCVCSPAITQK